jgi:hypothetical protein
VALLAGPACVFVLPTKVGTHPKDRNQGAPTADPQGQIPIFSTKTATLNLRARAVRRADTIRSGRPGGKRLKKEVLPIAGVRLPPGRDRGCNPSIGGEDLSRYESRGRGQLRLSKRIRAEGWSNERGQCRSSSSSTKSQLQHRPLIRPSENRLCTPVVLGGDFPRQCAIDCGAFSSGACRALDITSGADNNATNATTLLLLLLLLVMQLLLIQTCYYHSD